MVGKSREHYLFVTGTLAEPTLRNVLADLAPRTGFDYSVAVMPISIAALMSPRWIARRLTVPPEVTRVMVPGYCLGDLKPIAEVAEVPVERGPRELMQLVEHFQRGPERNDYGEFDIEILARLDGAAMLDAESLEVETDRLANDGAEMVVLGGPWDDRRLAATEAVRVVHERGVRVGIDNADGATVTEAVAEGAELVFSVDARNRRDACNWGVPVVVVPDAPGTLDGIEETLAVLNDAGVAARIDVGLDPIGFGLAASIERHIQARRRWPEAAMLMRVSTLTETTTVDSAGVNLTLLGICQELRIGSVLTSQRANWARSSIRECDVARRLAYYAVTRHVLPNRLDDRLVMLRDRRLHPPAPEALEKLAARLTDRSYRIFAEGGLLHAVSAGVRLVSNDPYDLLQQMLADTTRPLSPQTAYYLGYEVSKALTALRLGKNYRQDDALDWGMLTVPELTRRERRALRLAGQIQVPQAAADGGKETPTSAPPRTAGVRKEDAPQEGAEASNDQEPGT